MLIDSHAYHLSKHIQIMVGLDTWAFHPWDLHAPFDRKSFDILWCQRRFEEQLHNGSLLAIGECGLDRVHENIASIDDQKYVLSLHLKLARELKLPVIVHSVRSHSDVLEVLKREKYEGKIMLHAFSGNERELKEFLKFDCYFSYGARLQHTELTVKVVPLNRMLLESGDQSELSLEHIYSKASKVRGIELEVLKNQIKINFLTFFGYSDDVSAANFIKKLSIRSLV